MINIVWLFLIPLISALVLFLLGGLHARGSKALAVALSLIPLFFLIIFYPLGAEVNIPWMPAVGVNFHLKVDGIALVFLFLSAVIVPISLLASRRDTLIHPNAFYGLVLLILAFLVGFFTARDLFLFVLFFESLTLALYFIISIWGGEARKRAAMQFLIYMIVGSALLIVAILALYVTGGSLDLDILAKTAASSPWAPWVCGIFLLAFAVKTPLFPLHAWLPDAYAEASTSGTILLSALLSKAGIYGILRIVVGLFPEQLKLWSPWLLALAIAGVFYGGLAAWRQYDFKRLIAYSSLSHVNFILAGLFVWEQPAQTGAIIQAINHGITIAGLFLVAGWLENRLGTTRMGREVGLAKFLPHLCWLTLFFVLASVALPGLNNFVGELLILFGLFKENPWAAAILSLSVILSVIYMLRLMQKLYFGPPTFFKDHWVDIRTNEFAIALPLVALILWLGIYPSPTLDLIKPAEKAVTNLETRNEPDA